MAAEDWLACSETTGNESLSPAGESTPSAQEIGSSTGILGPQKRKFKGGKRVLKTGMPRLYRNHRSESGRDAAECWNLLAADLGPFGGIRRLQAGTVCAFWAEFRANARAVEAARRERLVGKGRRPNVQTIRSLEKRLALSNRSYQHALSVLRGMCGAQKAPDPAELYSGEE
jgi:hypothetical protein